MSSSENACGKCKDVKRAKCTVEEMAMSRREIKCCSAAVGKGKEVRGWRWKAK
jgi:hypothetical protein